MSAIKELIEEEKNAEKIIKDAEEKANQLLLNTKKKADEIIKNAENDDSVIKELILRKEQEIIEKRNNILKNYDNEAEEIENICKKNFEYAVKFVIDSVLGVST
jgi:vacuolar-type H+-ATPase subunit H